MCSFYARMCDWKVKMPVLGRPVGKKNRSTYYNWVAANTGGGKKIVLAKILCDT